MKNIIARLVVASLTFVVSVALTTLWYRVFRIEQIPTEWHRVGRKVSVQHSPQRQMTFTFKGIARVRTIDRGCVDVEEYESNDGKEVGFSVNDYDTPALAYRELQRMLEGDMKIIERENLSDGNGRLVGERIAALSSYDNGNKTWGYVLSTQGAKLYSISGSSLQHVLEFEKSRRR